MKGDIRNNIAVDRHFSSARFFKKCAQLIFLTAFLLSQHEVLSSFKIESFTSMLSIRLDFWHFNFAILNKGIVIIEESLVEMHELEVDLIPFNLPITLY